MSTKFCGTQYFRGGAYLCLHFVDDGNEKLRHKSVKFYVKVPICKDAYSPNIVFREIVCTPSLLTRNRMTVMYPSSRPSNNLQSEINSVDMSRLESSASDSPKCFFQIFHRELRLHFIFLLCVFRICKDIIHCR